MQLKARRAVPEYQKIADTLFSEIRDGCYNDAIRMPSELELCARFHVNRYAVRQSLELLMNMGVLRSHQGKGYFVCEKPLEIKYTITPAMRFSDVIRQLGRRPEARLLEQDIVPCPSHVAEALRISEDDEVYRLRILRLVDDVPLSWNETWLPVDRVPGFPEPAAGMTSLYDILEKSYGLQLHRIRSTFQSTYPTLAETGLLHISPSTSILLIESVMCDQNGRRVELTSAKYRGDLCTVAIDFDI